MASAEQWKPFKFFSSDAVRGTSLESLEMTTTCAGVSNVAIGDATGTIRIFDHSCKTTQLEFDAYTGAVTHLKLLRADLMLVSLGDDDSANVAIMRLWDLKRLNPTTKRPLMLREHRFFDAKYPPPEPSEFVPLRINFNDELAGKLKFTGCKKPANADAGDTPVFSAKEFKTCVTTFDVSEDFMHVVIALSNNEILFFRGDLEREKNPKLKRLRSSMSRKRLTFVGFPSGRKVTRPDSGHARSIYFVALAYAVYEDAVTVWRCTAKGDYLEHCFEPPMGAKFDCAMLNDAELVVASATSPQVAFFGGEQFMEEMNFRWDPSNLRPRRFCEIEGHKRKIGFHKHYLYVLSCPETEKRPERFTFQVYDVEARIKCLGTSQSNFVNVASIISGTSELLVVSQDAKSDTPAQKIVRLAEVDTQAKLDQLFKKGLYDEAKRLSKRLLNDDVTQQMDIRRKYGDHLYDKGKFDQAIEQYIEAIGYLEPSYVIRRFLDTQRIGNLTRYLEELHHAKHRIANKNHTTLLLNCYTKQKNEEKLNIFIRRRDIHIDVANAIRVCSDAGYYDAATYLAREHHEPGEYVKIQMEHNQNHLDALRFIRGLPVEIAERILLQHGKELLARVPVETTEILIQLCSEWHGPPRMGEQHVDPARKNPAGGAPSGSMAGHPRRTDAHNFIPIFVDSPMCLMQFLESVVKNSLSPGDESEEGSGETVVFNTLLELYLTRDLRRTIRSKESAMSGTTAIGNDSVISDHGSMESSYPQRLERALQILQEYEGRYDQYHALILVQQANFERGILFMLESMKLHREIFAYHAKRFEDTQLSQPVREAAKIKLIQLCEELPNTSANEEQVRELWISLMSALARCEYDVSADISHVLDRIDFGDMLPPIAVIDILCANRQLQLKTVRAYILRRLQKDYEKIEEHNKKIREWTGRTEQLKQDIRDLSTVAYVFQSNKCAACSSLLDNPSIHFLCRHSFHHRCLNDERECNLCGPENRKVLSLQKEFDDTIDQHETFFNRLRAAQDGFGIVAEYFGRSIFSNPTLRRQRLGRTAAAPPADEPISEDDVDEEFGDQEADDAAAENW